MSAKGGDGEAAPSGAEVEAAVKRFQELRSKEQQLLQKISEMAAQEQEFRLVSERLRPLDPSRRAYQLIGGVLSERTVGAVVPALEANRDAITRLIAGLNDQLKEANSERTALQKKHGIRVVSREQAERIAAEQQAKLQGQAQQPGSGAQQQQA